MKFRFYDAKTKTGERFARLFTKPCSSIHRELNVGAHRAAELVGFVRAMFC